VIAKDPDVLGCSCFSKNTCSLDFFWITSKPDKLLTSFWMVEESIPRKLKCRLAHNYQTMPEAGFAGKKNESY